MGAMASMQPPYLGRDGVKVLETPILVPTEFKSFQRVVAPGYERIVLKKKCLERKLDFIWSS